jgi:hypothetical protein
VFSISGTVSAGDAVYQVSGADNTVAQADASDAGKRPPIGIVESVSGSTCVVALNGEVATSLSGLTRGTVYWLGTVAGQLVSSKPATNSHALGIAVSATELRIDTVAYGINIAGGSGTVTSAGITSADLTVSNSPITTSGVIDLALNTVPVSKGGTGLTSAVEQGASLIASSSSAYVAQATSLSWRNRIINGDMRVAQRGTAAVSANGSYPVDRWTYYKNTGATASFQQSSVVPTYFANSVGLTVTTGGSATAAQYAGIQQAIEGCNVADLGWGTSAAKTITISFFVRSSITGTYCLSVYNYNGTKTYVATYSVSAQNSWQYKSVTIPGPTDGTWYTNNATGINMWFDLGTGSNGQTASVNTWLTNQDKYSTSTQANVIGTTGATFYLTGVQLELGSVATPFEMLQYEKQLELCQRYFARLSSLSGSVVGFGAGCYPSDTSAFVYIKYPQAMRSTPTLSVSSIGTFDTLARVTTWSTMYYGNNSMMATGTRTSVASSTGRGCVMTGSTASAYIDLNAEL